MNQKKAIIYAVALALTLVLFPAASQTAPTAPEASLFFVLPCMGLGVCGSRFNNAGAKNIIR